MSSPVVSYPRAQFGMRLLVWVGIYFAAIVASAIAFALVSGGASADDLSGARTFLTNLPLQLVLGGEGVLDRETGLLLKTQTQGHGNKILERFQFANLSFTGTDPGASEVALVHRADHPVLHEGEATAELSPSRWSIRWVPEAELAAFLEAHAR